MSESNPYLQAAQESVSTAFEFCTTRALAGKIELTFPSSVEGKELLRAAASAPQSEVREFSKKAKKRWGGEFNSNHFAADVKEARNSIGVASSSQYLLTGTGTLRPVVANAITMMANLPVRYNQLACRPELTAEPPWGGGIKMWSNHEDTKVCEWCQHQNLSITTNVAAEAIQAVAMERSYHPVKDYLHATPWDGKLRLCNWLTVYGGAEDTELNREIGVRWMISAVARAMEPGCQADYILVLEGDEGIKKSSALRSLAYPWFSDDISEIGRGHDAAVGLQGWWIVEVKELAAFRKSEWTQILGFLDRREDKFRPSYGRRCETFPRQNVFSGSTNSRQWITGEYGTRRFWPIWAKKMLLSDIERDRDQLWAEALKLYKAGERWYLDDDVNPLAVEAQRSRRISDGWGRIVAIWCQHPIAKMAGEHVDSERGRVYVAEVLEKCIGLPPAQWKTGSEWTRVETILRGLGYSRTEEGIYEKP